MPYEITRTDRWSGKEVTTTHEGSVADARGHVDYYRRTDGGQVTCVYVNKGPHTDGSGRREHIVTEGDKQK